VAEPLPRRSLRVGALLALAVVALFDLLALAHGIRSQARLRARVAQDADERLAAARPALEPLLVGGNVTWDAAAQLAISRGLASEVEVLAPDGSVIFSRPSVAPVVHRLSAAERERLASGGSLSVVARQGEALRLLTYLGSRPPRPTSRTRRASGRRCCWGMAWRSARWGWRRC
jgi:hypothetical protein